MRRSKGKGGGGKKNDKEKEKEEKQEVQKFYTARVFYIPQAATTWLMHFTIVRDLELRLKVCAYILHVGLSYNLNLSKISGGRNILQKTESVLELPKEGKTLPSGWTLQPLFYPQRVRKLGKQLYFNTIPWLCYFLFQLLRRSVDNYKPGRTIDSCQVELVWRIPAERLSYELNIRRLRPAETSITVTRDPSFPGQEKYLIFSFFPFSPTTVIIFLGLIVIKYYLYHYVSMSWNVLLIFTNSEMQNYISNTVFKHSYLSVNRVNVLE